MSHLVNDTGKEHIGQPSIGDEGSSVDLSLLLDVLSATEPKWAILPAPLPLFLHEAQAGLAGLLGGNDG